MYLDDAMAAWRVKSAVKRFVHVRREYWLAADAGLRAAGLVAGGYGAIHNRQVGLGRIVALYYRSSTS